MRMWIAAILTPTPNPSPIKREGFQSHAVALKLPDADATVLADIALREGDGNGIVFV